MKQHIADIQMTQEQSQVGGDGNVQSDVHLSH